MKNSLSALVAIAALLSFGCARSSGGAAPAGAALSIGGADDPVLRTHFAGTERLFAQAGTARLKQVWELPGSVALRNTALDRFARVPLGWLAADLSGNAPDHAALFRPLLEDIIARESYFELGAAPEFALAIRLPDERARLWRTNLANAITAWKLGTPANVSSSAGQGWEAKTSGKLKTVRFLRAGEWVVFAAGTEKLANYSNVLAAAKSSRPATGWLEGVANLQRLQRWSSLLPDYDNLPTARFSLSNREDVVRTLVQLDFARPHGWKSEPWRIPTNVLRDPLVSFTAARGIAPLLNSMKVVRDIGWQPTFNQFIAWANEQLGFQLNLAFPTSDVTNQLKRAAPKIESFIRAANTNLLGRFTWDEPSNNLFFHGLPVVPHLGPFRGPETEFLLFDVFRFPLPDTPPPTELLAELSGNDMAYYDWELTEFRIKHWQQLYQLAEIATRRALTPTNAPSERFLDEAARLLGNTGTKVTVTSPAKMTLLRNSHLGLTAFELVTLTRWLESTNFPAFGVFPPQPPPTRRLAK